LTAEQGKIATHISTLDNLAGNDPPREYIAGINYKF
jgi:hypothetical protein